MGEKGIEKMIKEKFTKALALTMAAENPDVVLKVMKAAGIEITDNSTVMDTIHKMREVASK